MKEKLKSMKVKDKLYMGYGVVIGIMIFLGVFALGCLVIIYGNFNGYINGVEKANESVKNCRIEINIAARYLREMVLNDDLSTYQDYQQKVQECLLDVDTNLSVIKQVGVLDEALYEEYETAIYNWENIGEQVINEILKGNHEKAVNLILNECTPALDNVAVIAMNIESQTEQSQENTVNSSIMFMIICGVVFVILLAVAVVLDIKLGKNIVTSILKPIEEIKNVAGELAEGNLHSNLEYHSNDEIGELANSLRKSIHILGSYVDDVSNLMKQFSDGNFDVQPEQEWSGDFIGILDSFTSFEDSMANTITGIKQAAAQVNGGAEQVAASSTDLAQGATDQAAVTEELTATIASVAEQVAQNSRNAQEISKKVEGLGVEIINSNEQMRKLVGSMQKISEASTQIGKIIEAINGIASQTNLLALNASIEAARAGEAGRGFAVVADQVSVLASQSAKAVKESAALIESSVRAVEDGMVIADETAKQLESVVNESRQITEEVTGIAVTLEEQNKAIEQINEGVEQINDVVQTNSATSEECAAASQEMSSQADNLEKLVKGFRIKDK